MPTYGLNSNQKEHCVKVGLNTRFKKGRIPWIKGKKGVFAQSEEFKKYMSKRMSGKNNPMYGMTKENCPNWKGKITYCLDCRKIISNAAKRCGSCSQK